MDIVLKVVLLVLNTSDIGNSLDPYQKALRSPKRQDDGKKEVDDKARSPSIDQVNEDLFYLFYIFFHLYHVVSINFNMDISLIPFC